jgi:DNA replication protein DnaD
MPIKNFMSNFFKFLLEFSQLSPIEQKIFLFCLAHKQHPRKYSHDVAEIAHKTGSHRKTVEKALKTFAAYPLLRKCVCYIHLDVKQEFYAQNKLFSEQGEPSEVE